MEGKKYSNHKAPIATVIRKQFPLAIEAVAMESKKGHEGDYKDFDMDWLNFKRVDNAEEQYENATVRHLMELGDDTEKEHITRVAWNALARLQIYLEKNQQ